LTDFEGFVCAQWLKKFVHPSLKPTFVMLYHCRGE